MKIIFRFILLITVLIGIEVNALYLTEGKINNYFKTEKYHIKLNGNGGIFSKQDHIIVFQKHMTLPTPTKEGYTFSHYSSSTCGWENDDFSSILHVKNTLELLSPKNRIIVSKKYLLSPKNQF